MSSRLKQLNDQTNFSSKAPSQNQFPFESLKLDIINILNQPNHDEYNHIGPILVRLAWHSSGTYSKYDKTGGSNGATMRFQSELKDPENNGLHLAQKYLE